MAYTKQTWADLPSKTTPINATRLTHIEDGIFNAAATADNAASAAGTAVSQIGQVSSRVDTLTDRVNGLDTAVSNKVDKVAGKGLSTNDYDDTDKGKVDSLGTASTKNSTSVVTDSTDLVESGAVKDIVGWGNKNLIYTKLSGYNVNSSGLVQAGSTYSLAVAKVEANKEYTVSPRASFTDTNIVFAFFVNEIIKNSVSYNNARTVVSTEDNSYTFTAPINGYVGVRINTVNDNIQLEHGSTATAYEPYHASVEDTIPQVVSDAIGWDVGNVLPNEIQSGSYAGVTWTVNSDGSITFNGTATYEIYNKLYFTTDWKVKAGVYYLNGGITGGPYFQIANKSESRAYFTKEGIANNVKMIVTDEMVNDMRVRAIIPNGTTLNNVTVKYVVTTASVDERKCDNSVIGTVEDKANPTKSYAVDEFMVRDGAFCQVTAPVTTSSTWTEGSNYTKKSIAEVLQSLMS